MFHVLAQTFAVEFSYAFICIEAFCIQIASIMIAQINDDFKHITKNVNRTPHTSIRIQAALKFFDAVCQPLKYNIILGLCISAFFDFDSFNR